MCHMTTCHLRQKIRTGLAESRDDEYNKLKAEKNSRQHHGSKTVQEEKAPSPKASRRLKLKNSVRTASPPHADQPIEFVKDVNKGIYVRSKAADHQQQQHVKKTASKEEELVMCMSKLPSYLKTGDNVQAKVLSYGVIDWVHLENWKQKQKRISGRDDKTASFVRSNSSATSSSTSQSYSSNKIDFRVAQPPNGEATDHPQHSNKQGLTCRQPELYGTASGKLFPKVVEKGSYQKSKLGPRTSSHPGNQVSPSSKENISGSPQEERTANGKGLESRSACQHFPSNQVSFSSKENSPDLNSQREERAAKGKGSESHSACQQTPCKNDNIILLLLPKDFSMPSSSEISRGTSLDGVSSEFSWNSFSDAFSIEDDQSENSFSDIPHFSPLKTTAECESQMDLKLDNLINAQGVELESDLPCLSPKLDRTLAAESMIKDAENKSDKNIGFPEVPKGLEQAAAGSVNAGNRYSSAARPLSFGRLGRSLSFREDAAVPQTSSTYVSAKSGPVRAEVSGSFDCTDSNKANPDGRCSNSPLRRLLSPLLKHRAGKPVSSSQSIQACPENPDDFSIRPGSALEALFHEKSRTRTTKAHLHVTVKGGLPLFKFLVETNNDILVSTVKKLTPFETDGPNWLYTFYSVHKVARKNGSWKNHVNKHKNTELSYTVAGQMKVSDPHFLVEEGQVMKQTAMESVLYGADLSKTEESTSEFTASKELAAIVVKMTTESLGTENNNRNGNLSSGWFDNAEENGNTGSIVVILPSGMHGLPSEGVPSPLISRWRSGGLCDCGGWDIGCRLRVLTNEAPDDKRLRASRACSMHDRLDLFIQGAAKQLKPTFSSVSQGNGLFSVEYDAAISSLQALAVCVAFVNRQKVTGSLHQKRHNESGQKHERSNS